MCDWMLRQARTTSLVPRSLPGDKRSGNVTSHFMHNTQQQASLQYIYIYIVCSRLLLPSSALTAVRNVISPA